MASDFATVLSISRRALQTLTGSLGGTGGAALSEVLLACTLSCTAHAIPSSKDCTKQARQSAFCLPYAPHPVLAVCMTAWIARSRVPAGPATSSSAAAAHARCV